MNKKAIAQQRFQEMARNVVNSRLSFARKTILVENMRLRSSPLLEAAKRCTRLMPKLRRKNVANQKYISAGTFEYCV